MIKIDPPTFTMRMDDIKFKEEKEVWQRYLIRNPPNNSMVCLEQRQKNPGCEDALHPGKFLRVRKVFARIYKIDP